MNATELLSLIALGGLMGAIGQGIRVAPGLKKTHDQAVDQQQTFKEAFETSRLVISLLIGFFVGSLTILSLDGYATINELDRIWASSTTGDEEKRNALSAASELLLGLAAAGYAGTDLVEGLVKRRLPGLAGKNSAPTTTIAEPDAGLPAQPGLPPAIG